MTTVKRNAEGEITHVLVGADFLPKEDANKVLYDSVDVYQVESFIKKEISSDLKPLPLIQFITHILNEREDIFALKKKIFDIKSK